MYLYEFSNYTYANAKCYVGIIFVIFRHVYPISSDSSTPWRPSIYPVHVFPQYFSTRISLIFILGSHLRATSMFSAIAHLTLFLKQWMVFIVQELMLFHDINLFINLINFSLSIYAKDVIYSRHILHL